VEPLLRISLIIGLGRLRVAKKIKSCANKTKRSRLFEIALVLVRFDQVAGRPDDLGQIFTFFRNFTLKNPKI
jgi:hypothetical protein